MDAVANDRRTNNSCSYIESFGRWIGRKITTNPAEIRAVINLIRGAACFPIVWLGHQAMRSLYVMDMKETSADDACPAGMLEEIATFSLPRRIVAPIALIFFTSVIIPIIEEVIFRDMVQGAVLKEKFTTFLEKYMPSAVEFWNSKKGKSVRVIMSTSAFSAAHLINSPAYSLAIIPLGLATSTLKEQYGTDAAIGLHVMNNIIANIERVPLLLRCYWAYSEP